MGQNLTCCSNSNVDTTNDFKTNDFKNQYKITKDKMHLIIRIQAAFRGFLARKRVQRIREQTGYTGGGMFNKMMNNDGV